MLEVELKFPVADLAALAERLVQEGAQLVASRQDADHYFNAPDRDFAHTDEAFRLRRIGSANLVCYKGPRLDRQTKTRLEIEVPLAEGDEAAADFGRLLECLGYRLVAVVHKRRQVFQVERAGHRLQVCLDEVEGLGPFAELEIMAEPAQREEARNVLLRAAAELGLQHAERRSYLELLLQARSQREPPLADTNARRA